MKVNVLSGDENSQKLLLQACVPFMDLKDNPLCGNRDVFENESLNTTRYG